MWMFLHVLRMTPKTCLPFIFILSSLPFCLSFCVLSSLLHAFTHSFTHFFCTSFPRSLTYSLAVSLTRPPVTHTLTNTHARTHFHSSAPEGSNRRYMSVSLPSPCPNVSLQQICRQRCRKSRFWRWKRRTKVRESERDGDWLLILILSYVI